MFVINFKLDFKKIFICCVVIAIILATIIEFGTNAHDMQVNANNPNYDFDLNDQNYTKSLKQIHDNIDTNLGKTIHITGFVFRMADFKENYIVCGRNTISNSEDKVAGILCDYQESKNLVDNEWVEITGVITKGNYNGDMPIVKVGTLKKITAPANTFVDNVLEKQDNNNDSLINTENNNNSTANT